MAKYQITTDKGTFEVETDEGQAPSQNTLNGAPAAKPASPEQRKLWDSMKGKGDPAFDAAIEKLSQSGDGESHLMRDIGSTLASPVTGLAGIPDAIRSWLSNPKVGDPNTPMAGDIFGNAMGALLAARGEVGPQQAAQAPPTSAPAPFNPDMPLAMGRSGGAPAQPSAPQAAPQAPILKGTDILHGFHRPIGTAADILGRIIDRSQAAPAQAGASPAAPWVGQAPEAAPPPGPMDAVTRTLSLARFKKSPTLRAPKQAPDAPAPNIYQQQMGAGARLPLPKPGSLAEQSAEAQAAAPPAAQQTGRLNGRGMVAPGAEAPPKAAAAKAPAGAFTDWFNKPAEAQDFIARNANFKVSPTQFGGKPGVPFRASRPPDTVAPKSIASIPATGAASWSQAMGLSPDMGLAMLKQAGWLITK